MIRTWFLILCSRMKERLIKLHLWQETPLEKKFREWTAQYLREGEYINIAYFVQVLGEGENEMAQDWMKRAEKRKQLK